MCVRRPASRTRHLFLSLSIVWSLVSAISAAAESLNAVMIVDTPDAAAKNAETVLRGNLADLSVALTIESLSEAPQTFDELYRVFSTRARASRADVVFLVDMDASSYATVYISLPQTGTTLVRHVEFTDETPEGRYEMVAVIVRGILTAMSTGGEIGVYIPDVPPPANEVDEEASNRGSQTDAAAGAETRQSTEGNSAVNMVMVRAAYGLSVAAEETSVVHHFRLAVGGDLRYVAMFAAYRFTLPFGSENDDVALSLTPHPVSVGAAGIIRFSKGRFLMGLEGIIDPLSLKVTPKSEQTAAENDNAIRVAVSPFVMMDWHVARCASIYAAASFDVYVYQPVFKVREEEEPVKFLSLYRFSPFFHIGMGFGVAR